MANEMMPEAEGAPADMSEDMNEGENMQETSQIPASLVDGQPQPGETISLSVISVDQQNGMITVAKAGGAEQSAPGGVEQMASEFNQPPQ